MENIVDKFNLKNKVCVITGGAGFLGTKHAEVILEMGGTAVLLDIDEKLIKKATSEFSRKYNKKYDKRILGIKTDITNKKELEKVKNIIICKYKHIDILINNAANNPKVESKNNSTNWTRFENFPEKIWEDDLSVGLKGSFFCSQIFGGCMLKQNKGVILNISSDLGIVAPDQRIYRKKGLKEEEQMVKPITYSIVKHGMIGLTKYLATYWAEKNIRVNAVCPGGVFNGQEADFVKRLTNLIPIGRMAYKDEYKATILYLISEASSYMTGSVVIVDGGRTCW